MLLISRVFVDTAGLGADLLESNLVPASLGFNHGRALAFVDSEGNACIAKGIGWSLGCFFPMAVRSRKETSTVFGLLGERDAQREVVVSRFLREKGMTCTEVLGFDYVQGFYGFEDSTALLQQAAETLTQAPVVLYTRMLTRYRVADLPLLTIVARQQELERIAKCNDFHGQPWEWFANRLATQVALLHKLGGVNDTLEWSNVTAAAEVTDFEWITVPGIPLHYHDGTLVDDKEHLPERQWKEVIYGVEVCLRFAALLGDETVQEQCVQRFLDKYLEEGGPATEAVMEFRQPLTLKKWPPKP